MKKIFWLVILFLLLKPQAGSLGFSPFKPTLSVNPDDILELNNLNPIQIRDPADILAINTLDAYPIHPGYPIDLARWIEKAPVTIADINGDGSNEMLLPTYNEGTPYPGKIYAWDNNGNMLPGFPISTDGHLRGRLALGDLNEDGKLEIAGEVKSFNLDIGAKVYIWKSDGTILPGWPQETACYQDNQYCGVQSIVISDIDGDSDLEVIAGTDNRHLTYDPADYIPNLYVWHSNGQPVAGNWPSEDERHCAIIGALAVGDLDGNGSVDIVTGRDYFRLFAYDNQGNDLPGWPRYVFWPYDSGDLDNDKISFGRSAVTLADLNQDGILEYVVDGLRSYSGTETFYNDDLLVYGSDGQRWQGWDLPATGYGLLAGKSYRMLQAPAIGDMNGDSLPDIVVTQQDGWARAYTAQKQLLWEFNYAQGQIIYATEPIIGDVNGDGWNEVLFGTFDIDFHSPGPLGVYILDHNGVPLAGADPLVVATDIGVSGAPTLADLDGDGNIEITAVTWRGKIYVWDAPGQALPARMPWPMARHDLQRTGYYTELDTVTLTINQSPGGTITPDPDGPYHLNDPVSLTATPNAGWNFSAWTGDCTGHGNPCSLIMNANKTVSAVFSNASTSTPTRTATFVPTATNTNTSTPTRTATFVPTTTNTNTSTPTRTATFTPTPENTNTSTPALTATSTPIPTNDYTSTPTRTASSTPIPTNTYTSTPAHTAIVTELPIVNLAINPSTGGTTNASPAGPYHLNDVVTLTAIPNQGYNFFYWSGDARGTINPTTITMNGNKTVGANFQQGTLRESFDSLTGWTVKGGGLMTLDTENYRQGIASIKLTMPVRNGYEIITKTVNWDLSVSLGSVKFWLFVSTTGSPTSFNILLSNNTIIKNYFLANIPVQPGWNLISLSTTDWVKYGNASWTQQFIRVQLQGLGSRGAYYLADGLTTGDGIPPEDPFTPGTRILLPIINR